MDPSIAFPPKDKSVWVAGHSGMADSALVRRLASESCHVLTATREEVDLTRQAEVEKWMNSHRPDVVFLAAAKVGAIQANNAMPAAFSYENIMIETNVVHAAKTTGVQKLISLGSTCIYPKMAPQPIVEEAFLTSPLEPTNEWHAIARIAGIKLCQAHRRQYGCDFIAAQPTNLYGPGDNYDLTKSHVLPALLRKAIEAKASRASTMTVWGTGTPLREFLHVDDLADATVHLAKNYSGEGPINVSYGEEISIRELAGLICQVVGFNGNLEFDATKPDGTPRKLCDTSKLNALGWNHARKLELGISELYRDAVGTLR